MERMFQEANRLVCRWDGETLIVEPWGENGLRVRSAMLREPEDTDYALLPQERAEAVITVGEERSEIRNGKIIGVMEKGKNSGAVLSFYNSEGKLLLAEAGEDGGKVFAFLTDLGEITPTAAEYIRKANYLILEANYDEEMLRMGTYPQYLKERITSRTGHMSNIATAELDRKSVV